METINTRTEELVRMAREANVEDAVAMAFRTEVIHIAVDLYRDEIYVADPKERSDLIFGAKKEADEINNSGLAAQIEFMLDWLHYNVEMSAAHIEAEIREHAQAQAGPTAFPASNQPPPGAREPVGWQVVQTSSDDPAPAFTSFELLPLEDALDYIQHHNRQSLRLLPVWEGDIERPEFVRWTQEPWDGAERPHGGYTATDTHQPPAIRSTTKQMRINHSTTKQMKINHLRAVPESDLLLEARALDRFAEDAIRLDEAIWDAARYSYGDASHTLVNSYDYRQMLDRVAEDVKLAATVKNILSVLDALPDDVYVDVEN